ncbi:MAG: FAD binding domain-containing protein [Mycobacteriales bacterium]
MDFLAPTTWPDALAAKAEHPEAVAIAGGTDLMVELNFDRRRPDVLLDLGRVGELTEWGTQGGRLRIGAAVPYTRLISELGDRLPGLAMASRTIGSPQIRNRATLGGNLGTASPAGDAHPPLLAAGAAIEVESAQRGVRQIPIREFFTGTKRNALAPDELIAAVILPAAPGPQQFAKVGTRNAMVISVCAFSLALDPHLRTVGTGIGSAGPTPLVADGAARLAEGGLDWDGLGPADPDLLAEFGRLAGEAAQPIDDVRGTAAYRRRALGVLARRTLTWAWEEHRCA